MVDERKATELLPPSITPDTCGTPAGSLDVIAALTKAGEKLAENAPPLTAEQVDRVVAILRLSDGGGTELKDIA